MKTTTERELKLDAPAGYVLPDLGGRPLERRVFTSTYYDVPGASLARVGITLRRRVENGVSLWQLKLPAEEGRLELEVPGGPAAPPGELATLLFAHTRRGALESVAELRTIRAGTLLEGLAEVVVDEVTVMEGNRAAQSFTEVELELLDGSLAALDPVARKLRRAGAQKSNGRPKLLRVLGAVIDEPAEPIRRWFATQVGEVLAHDPGTRLDADPESLHRHRVAVRRLRALLRAEQDLLEPERHERLRTELKWAGTALGEVRDLDVMLDHLHPQVATLGREDERAARTLIGRLEQQRRRVRKQLLAALDSGRYLALLDELEEAVPLVRAVEADELRTLARKEFRTLARDARATPEDAPDAELHALRIRGKRARYAAELASVAGVRVDDFVKQAKQFQDVLGEHQDAVVLEERLRTLLRPSDPPARAIALGRLIERERERRQTTRDEWPSAWKALRRSGKRTWS